MLQKLKGATPADWGNRLILSATFLLMLVFNCLTPLISDDYTYLLRYPSEERVKSLWDIVVSQMENYQLWSGRNIALGLNQLFLFVGKWSFNLCNAAAFCLLMWLCARLIVGKGKVPPLLLLGVVGLMVHCNPCFGAVNLWMCGSCVYLWPLLFAAAFLLPYRLALDGVTPTGKAVFFLCLLGFLAGWGNENTSGAAFLASFLFTVILWIFNKKAPKWGIAGAVSCLAGFAVMMLAPGQWVRMDSVVESGGDTRSTLTILLTRLMNATHSLKLYGLWLVVLFGMLYFALWLCTRDAKQLLLPGVWFVLALAANYALILCPVYYVRSFYPVLFFLVLSICSCILALAQCQGAVLRLSPALLAGGLCAVLCFDLLEGGYDIVSYYTMRRVRDDSITQQVAAGETDIETYAVFPYTRFCGAWGQPDLRSDPNNWVNRNASLHFGAASITATEQHYYPFPGYDDFSQTVEQEMSFGLEEN